MVLLELRLPAEHRAAWKSSSICIFMLALDYKHQSAVFMSKVGEEDWKTRERTCLQHHIDEQMFVILF